MKIGMIFPGQGAQHMTMGKEMYDRERLVQEFFEEASNCLDQNFVRLCFASSEKELRETVNAQTSIFLVSAALYAVLHQKYNITPDIVAGHSSGEYAAMYSAGGMTFVDALYLLKKRSSFMEDATRTVPGSMMAVVGVSFEELESICRRYDDPTGNDRVVEAVNYNAPDQVVISGTLPELEAVASDVRTLKGKIVPLSVAGAFHSRLMAEAEKLFSHYLVKVDFKDLTIPLVNNLEARIISKGADVKASLARQMSSHVLWWPSMQQFKECDLIIEVGPGNRLSKMLKRQWPEKNIVPFNCQQDLEAIVRILDKEVIAHSSATDDEQTDQIQEKDATEGS
ncbi:MAG: ACP S-malonyltransferase [Candidatus Babeliales bacterium]|jgi:[acyl-carrier-protein] S-malonyltransferase